MNKTSFMNGVTVAAYAAIAVYLMVVLITFGIWVTGGFRKYTAEAGGLKFDCMAVSISDNAGTANVKVLSNNATTTLNLSNAKIDYSDPSVPIEIKLELRDQNNRIIPEDEAIVEVPNKVMLGESFEISAILDLDGFNKGGDCYLYAYSMDDMLYANPLHIFVDVPVDSASLMYYNINANLNQSYKRIVETNIEGQERPLRTTLFYNNANDFNNNTNPIIPLNREVITQGENTTYREVPLSCVKGDKFKLYVQIWPQRSLNPHKSTNTASIQSSTILKNLDAVGLANICTKLTDAYADVGDDDELLQNYVEQFEKVWSQLGLNNFVNLNGLITKNKISQAVKRVQAITSYAINNYYSETLGSTIVFNDKAIIYETPRRDVAEVDEANEILVIKSEPRNASDTSVHVNVNPIYSDGYNGLILFKAFSEQETVTDVEIASDFEIGNVYFLGLGFEEGITKSSISSQLAAILNVNTERLVLTARGLSEQDKNTLLSTNGLTQSELDNAVNLNILIHTQGNNQESNPTPLISEMKNLNIVQVVENNSNPAMLPLNIIADNTTLGDVNKIWIITANRSLSAESSEKLYLTLSLVQEINVSELEEPDVNANGDMVTEPYTIEEYECKNSLNYKAGTENLIAQKTSSIENLVFEIKIEKPSNMQFKRNVNIEFTKYDDGRNKDIGTPISLESLMTTYGDNNPYIPENYTYGKIIYVVNDTNETPSTIINTTGNGLLYYSYSSATDPDELRYGYIEPMGAGTVTITPYLVMTEREDGKEYAIKYDTTEQKYVRIVMSEAVKEDFEIIDTYNTITVKVTERIVGLTYYLDEGLAHECSKNDTNRYFATGAKNSIALYIRANSSRALPGSDTEYQGLGYGYSYTVTTGGQPTNELSISYPEEKRFDSYDFKIDDEHTIKVNCMAILITINPLSSTESRVYTITWFKGTEEIPDSQIYINARDYFGTSENPIPLSFEKNAVEKQKSKEYTAKFVKDTSAGANVSRYLVKWNAGEEDAQMLSLPDVYYLPTANEYLNPESSGGVAPYIQTTLYPSVPTTETVFYWIRDPYYDSEGKPTYTYDVLNVSNTYFTITETTTSTGEGENAQTVTVSTLYIKDYIPNNALGVRIGYRYSPGVTLSETVECDYDIFLNWPVLEYGAPSEFTVDNENRRVTVTLPPLHAYTNELIDFNATLDIANNKILLSQDSVGNYQVNDEIRIYEGSTLVVDKAKITSIQTDDTTQKCILQLQNSPLTNLELSETKQYHIYKLTNTKTFVENNDENKVNTMDPVWRVLTEGVQLDSNDNYQYTMLVSNSVNITNLNTIQMNKNLVLRFKIPTSGNGYSDKSNYSDSVILTKQV